MRLDAHSTDGHTGIGMQKRKEVGSGHFNFIIATLENASGDIFFVIHASSNLISQNPFRFLENIGFSHFNGQCPFYHDTCFYRIIAAINGPSRGIDHFWEVQGIYENFDRFIEKIGDLYSLYEEQNNILRWLGEQAQPPNIFSAPPMIEIKPSDIPLWTSEAKFEKLTELESKVKQMSDEIKDLTGYLPLLYSSGDTLVDAVIKALRYIGLKAQHTKKGFTVDVLAQTQDGTKKFGFEVTGLSDAIKKSSKKLTQVLEFERIKESDEKTILVANTHNTIPISERESKEDFTTDVVKFLGLHPILLMTSWDLYRMIQDVMENGKNPEVIIDILYNSTGVYRADCSA